VFSRPVKFARPPLAVPPRLGPAPRSSSHLPRLWVTRHQRGFTHVRPSGLPLACAPGWNGTRFGFFPELRTPQLPATHVRAGTDPEHWPEAMPPTSPALHPASSLATCDLVSHGFRPVHPSKNHLAPLADPAMNHEPEDSSSSLMDQCSGHDIPPAVRGDLTSQQGHDLTLGLKARGAAVLTCWWLSRPSSPTDCDKVIDPH
jgi:hypothetical protein